MSSVTMHAKTVGRNDMPFGRETHVVPRNIVLDRGPGLPTGRGDLGIGTPVGSNAAYHWITLAVVLVIIGAPVNSIMKHDNDKLWQPY